MILDQVRAEFHRSGTPPNGDGFCDFNFYRRGTAPPTEQLNKWPLPLPAGESQPEVTTNEQPVVMTGALTTNRSRARQVMGPGATARSAPVIEITVCGLLAFHTASAFGESPAHACDHRRKPCE